MNPRIVSVLVGTPKQQGIVGSDDPMLRPMRTAFWKLPVIGPVRVTRTNLEGDCQADPRYHGGPDKAILAYSADHYPYWREQLEIEVFPYGAFGENLTISGLSEQTVCVGDTWAIGSGDYAVHVQVSQPRQPCIKLARRWRMPNLPDRVIENGFSGWYLRALREGFIEAGQTMTLLDRPNPQWTIVELNQLMFHRIDDVNAASEAANLESLSTSWRDHFAKR